MASLTTLYWRDIPAQVIAKAGRTAAKRQLSDRFQEAIDRAAMRTKAHDAGTYLEEWRRGEPQPCDTDLESAVAAAAQALETAYDEDRLARLVKSGGSEDV
ncbi:MAG: virulence factor [Rhodospirillales bacterium]|nr:virulence factor [Rhodospirillales bacterium]